VHPVELCAILDTYRELRDGRHVMVDAVDLGYWAVTRTIELPFPPSKGLRLTGIVGRDHHALDLRLWFDVTTRPEWDCVRQLWRVAGQINQSVPLESDQATVQRLLPGWFAEWMDESRYDAEGNVVPAQRRCC
jgi:hypothetical protein